MTDQPANHRPYRAMSADGHEIVVTTDTDRLVLRQVGWLGQTGAFYALDENPLGDGYERGGVAPLYFPAHSDRLDDITPDDAAVRDAARQAAGQPAADEAPQYGVDGCTCRPWTNRGDGARWCTPDDTVDMVAGWNPGPGCPRHPAAGLAAPTNRNTETARSRLAALIGYESDEHDAEFEKRVDALIAASLHEAARRMEGAGHDDDAVAFLDLLAARQTAGAES